MRYADLHKATTTVPSSGMGINPLSDTVGLTVKAFAAGNESVETTFSVMGSVGDIYDKEPILFGGASIISLAGTGKAQWSGEVENCRFSNVNIDLLTMGASTISFNARATDGEV